MLGIIGCLDQTSALGCWHRQCLASSPSMAADWHWGGFIVQTDLSEWKVIRLALNMAAAVETDAASCLCGSGWSCTWVELLMRLFMLMLWHLPHCLFPSLSLAAPCAPPPSLLRCLVLPQHSIWVILPRAVLWCSAPTLWTIRPLDPESPSPYVFPAAQLKSSTPPPKLALNPAKASCPPSASRTKRANLSTILQIHLGLWNPSQASPPASRPAPHMSTFLLYEPPNPLSQSPATSFPLQGAIQGCWSTGICRWTLTEVWRTVLKGKRCCKPPPTFSPGFWCEQTLLCSTYQLIFSVSFEFMGQMVLSPNQLLRSWNPVPKVVLLNRALPLTFKLHIFEERVRNVSALSDKRDDFKGWFGNPASLNHTGH